MTLTIPHPGMSPKRLRDNSITLSSDHTWVKTHTPRKKAEKDGTFSGNLNVQKHHHCSSKFSCKYFKNIYDVSSSWNLGSSKLPRRVSPVPVQGAASGILSLNGMCVRMAVCHSPKSLCSATCNIPSTQQVLKYHAMQTGAQCSVVSAEWWMNSSGLSLEPSFYPLRQSGVIFPSLLSTQTPGSVSS